MQASLTGHLVMSTLHTNTAIGAITRMRDMGIEPFLLSSSLLAVLAQRLVRTLCPDCRAPPCHRAGRLAMGIELAPDQQIWRPVGCEQCNHTGYRGRTGIHELVVVDEAVREAIHSASGELAIERLIGVTPQHPPRRHRQGAQGQTSLEEVLRVTGKTEMAAFEYKALDGRGRNKSGVLEGIRPPGAPAAARAGG